MKNRVRLAGVLCAGLLIASMGAAVRAQTPPAGSPVAAAPGQPVKMMLLPKFLGIVPFDQAHQGAQEAAAHAAFVAGLGEAALWACL